MPEPNLMMPGNPRYQPKALVPYFGYDNLVRGLAEVEIAVLHVMGEVGAMPAADYALLTPEVEMSLLAITTTEVDHIERTLTKHDVRAWVRAAQQRVPEALGRWIHIPLTSFDGLDSGRILMFLRAHDEALAPSVREVVRVMRDMVIRCADQVQVGRTHGQHALPITVGFWLATTLSRILYNAGEMDRAARLLVGKISGAVGAYNAQDGLGIEQLCGEKTFEERVLERLGLRPARISTQILPPEPLEYYLNACCMLSASLAQFGRDCRHLMRSEIAEIVEEKEPGAVGSSTMAQKINPVNLENLETQWLKNIGEFVKVLVTMISEHQRDLTGSGASRDFPTILINTQQQLDTLLRKDQKTNRPFLERLTINREACERNFNMSAYLLLAEPLYIALQMAGYEGDAHQLVNDVLAPASRATGKSLIEVLIEAAQHDRALSKPLVAIPDAVLKMLHTPQNYTGRASKKALEIAGLATVFIERKV